MQKTKKSQNNILKKFLEDSQCDLRSHYKTPVTETVWYRYRYIYIYTHTYVNFQGGSAVKNPSANARDMDLIFLGRLP